MPLLDHKISNKTQYSSISWNKKEIKAGKMFRGVELYITDMVNLV